MDEAFSRFDLSRRADYGRFLRAQAAALIPVERALDAGVAPRLGIDWRQRRRAPALLADLTALGLSAPAAEQLAPFDEPEAALGTIYVLEGSRFGGAVLKRKVAPGLPIAFLVTGTSASWRKLLQSLNSSLLTGSQLRAAIEAAEFVFRLFESAARSHSIEVVQ